MTYFHVDIMWAIVLFGVLLWTTVTVVLNAALRRGMGTMGMVLSYAVLIWITMGMVLSYAVLIWMLIDLPLRDALTTWAVFAALGGCISFAYELWARRRYADRARRRRPLIRLDGIVRWPALVPDAFGLVLNDLGILPSDDRSETHQEDALRVTGAHGTTKLPP